MVYVDTQSRRKRRQRFCMVPPMPVHRALFPDASMAGSRAPSEPTVQPACPTKTNHARRLSKVPNAVVHVTKTSPTPTVNRRSTVSRPKQSPTPMSCPFCFHVSSCPALFYKAAAFMSSSMSSTTHMLVSHQFCLSCPKQNVPSFSMSCSCPTKGHTIRQCKCVCKAEESVRGRCWGRGQGECRKEQCMRVGRTG